MMLCVECDWTTRATAFRKIIDKSIKDAREKIKSQAIIDSKSSHRTYDKDSEGAL
jgi:hypothetical protein